MKEKKELKNVLDMQFPPKNHQMKKDGFNGIRSLFKKAIPQIGNIELEKRKEADERVGKKVDDILQYKYDDIMISNIFKKEWKEQCFKKGIDVKSLTQKYDTSDIYPLKTKLTKEQVEELAIRFFNDFDSNIGLRVQEIIADKGKNSDTQKISLKYGKNGTIRAETTSPIFQTDDIEVNIPLYGDLRDLYTMVHEFSHTLDARNGTSEARLIFTEVGAQGMERLLDEHLLGMSVDELKKYGIDNDVLKEDIKDREISTFFTRLKGIEKLGNLQGPRKTEATRYMFAQIFQAQLKKFSKDEKKKKMKEFYKSVLSNDIDNIENLFGVSLSKNKNNSAYINDTISDFLKVYITQNGEGYGKDVELSSIEKESEEKEF